MWLRVPSPGAAQPGREDLGIQGWDKPGQQEGTCACLCCDADGPWGLGPGQWPGFQHQEQPDSGQQRLFSLCLISCCRERSWHCLCTDRCSAPRWDELACLDSGLKGALWFYLEGMDGAFGWAFLSHHHALAELEQHQALPRQGQLPEGLSGQCRGKCTIS